MIQTTYSFAEFIMTFTHPLVGSQSTSGQGLGGVTVSYASDKTAHDLAADGAVMVSRIPGHHGTVAVNIQQTSSLHQFLLNYYSFIKNSPSALWAQAKISIVNPNTLESHTCTGVSPQKPSDRPYQAQGQMVTWTFMVADISQMAV